MEAGAFLGTTCRSSQHLSRPGLQHASASLPRRQGRMGITGTLLAPCLLVSTQRARRRFRNVRCVSRNAAPSLAELESLAEQVRRSRELGPARDDLEDLGYYSFDSYYTRGGGSRRGFCNWLLRDVLMVGRYPYCDPLGEFPSKEDGRRHLRRMLEIGISAFVCMQSEIPSPAPENLKAWPWEGVSLPATWLLFGGPWSCLVLCTVAVGGFPKAFWFRVQGLGSHVNKNKTV